MSLTIIQVFSCDNRGDCDVWECLLPEDMEAGGDASATLEIQFTFDKVTSCSW